LPAELIPLSRTATVTPAPVRGVVLFQTAGAPTANGYAVLRRPGSKKPVETIGASRLIQSTESLAARTASSLPVNFASTASIETNCRSTMPPLAWMSETRSPWPLASTTTGTS